MTKKETKKIAEDVIKIIQESKATFFVSEKTKDIQISKAEALYELKADIIDNVSIYFYKLLDKLCSTNKK